MKKIQLMVVGLAALMVSGIAVADYPELGGGSNPVTMVNCGLLANDVNITMTSNVVGGLQCDTDNNFVALSTCHTSGLTISRSAVVTHDADGVEICTISDTEDCVETVTGSAYPTATTLKGTVASQYPGNDCSTATALANANAQTVPE